MNTITKTINIIRREWRSTQPSTRLLFKLSGNLLLLFWLLGWATNVVAAYDDGQFVHTYPAAAFAVIGVLTATAQILLVTTARLLPIVWHAIRGQISWRQAASQVSRYWVVGRTWLHGSVVLASGLLAGLILLDGGHNSLKEPRWLQISAFAVLAFQLGYYGGRVRQRRRQIRDELDDDDVCDPCHHLNHSDCESLEDGDVTEDAMTERLCCCGIPVAYRPPAVNPILEERV